MKRRALLLSAAVLGAFGMARADYTVANDGQWPKYWPAELEPLRKQSRTLEGPLSQLHYEIPFKSREEFEAAWPHLVKVKGKSAAIHLVRGPHHWLGATMEAGVRVHSPERDAGSRRVDFAADPPKNWQGANYLEVVVDGKIVDLNRIELPPDTTIMDNRFKPAPKPVASQKGDR
ncbi:MAG TPA: hypothetical protein VNC50_11750 [Planctomycetia bacterium]|nr:hypothetical protein [Planctomycetia bacterium]